MYKQGNVLRCPFCEAPIEDPHEIASRFGNVFTGGRCLCGAVFVYDQSGHNVGDAYVDVMNFACEGTTENVWELAPGEDYEIVELTYHARRNKFGHESASRGKPVPVYLFVKLRKAE